MHMAAANIAARLHQLSTTERQTAAAGIGIADLRMLQAHESLPSIQAIAQSSELELNSNVTDLNNLKCFTWHI